MEHVMFMYVLFEDRFHLLTVESMYAAAYPGFPIGKH